MRAIIDRCLPFGYSIYSRHKNQFVSYFPTLIYNRVNKKHLKSLFSPKINSFKETYKLHFFLQNLLKINSYLAKK